jgi:DNA-directed RNA polymerase subunit H (RpoH/RPB5)
MKSYVSILQQKNLSHAVIVYDNLITSSTKKLLTHLLDMKIELFSIDELQYNLTHHVLFARHEKVKGDELQRIRPLIKKLPIILKTDPVCRYYNFNRNDILKIFRRDGSVSYRVVH